MADKEATVYILDLGRSMGKCNSRRTESDLDWSMRYVWDKLGATVAAGRKTLCVGVLGLRTEETDNRMGEEDGYENISELLPLGPIDMSSLRGLQSKIKVHDQMGGDAVSAVIVAIEMIAKFTKKLKYSRRIILVTDGMGPIDGEDFEDIANKMAESDIDLVVLGVDFDDIDYGFEQQGKPKLKAKNERLLRNFCHQCEGTLGTMAEAIAEMDTPRTKTFRPYRTYEGTLTLGDLGEGPDGLTRSVSISVERYFKTHLAEPQSASTVVLKKDEAGAGAALPLEEAQAGGALASGQPDYAPIRSARTYRVSDPDAPGGKRDVEFDSLAKGYKYGCTAVHISESEHNITKLQTEKSFTIIGFIPWFKMEPFLSTGACCQTVASRFNETSALALSSLVNALWELESFAVARLVAKDGREPQLLLLMPEPAGQPECLYDVPLPFAEDVRTHVFPPLDCIVTVSGATLTKHRNLPSQELSEAMARYVDAMDLSSFERDHKGMPAEYAAIEDTYNPTIHRLNQAIRRRATQPGGPVGEPEEILLKYSHPPEKLVKEAREEIEKLIEVAQVKKVPPKEKGKRGQNRRETVTPLSNLDIDSLLSSNTDTALTVPDAVAISSSSSNPSQDPQVLLPRRQHISPENAIPDFKRAVSLSTSIPAIRSAAKQMSAIITSLITSSLGDNNYARAVENMRVMRHELIAVDEPDVYNSFVRDLKARLLSGELGGDRREMWWMVRAGRLGLVEVEESELSGVSGRESAEFYLGRE